MDGWFVGWLAGARTLKYCDQSWRRVFHAEHLSIPKIINANGLDKFRAANQWWRWGGTYIATGWGMAHTYMHTQHLVLIPIWNSRHVDRISDLLRLARWFGINNLLVSLGCLPSSYSFYPAVPSHPHTCHAPTTGDEFISIMDECLHIVRIRIQHDESQRRTKITILDFISVESSVSELRQIDRAWAGQGRRQHTSWRRSIRWIQQCTQIQSSFRFDSFAAWICRAKMNPWFMAGWDLVQQRCRHQCWWWWLEWKGISCWTFTTDLWISCSG